MLLKQDEKCRVALGSSWASLVYTTENKEGETLFQTRWKARTKTQGCPLTSTWMLWHMYLYLHTWVYAHVKFTDTQKIVTDFTLMKFAFIWSLVGCFFFFTHPMLCIKHRLWYEFCIANLENSGHKINLTLKYSHLVAPKGERAGEPVLYLRK